VLAAAQAARQRASGLAGASGVNLPAREYRTFVGALQVSLRLCPTTSRPPSFEALARA
jgi:hypothetical protein